MFERSTKIWLVVYALYTLAYLLFVQRPAPPFEPAGSPRALAQPEGGQLLGLHVLPSETRALAGVGTEAGGELWLVDWARVDDWLRGDASLSELRLARMAASRMPQYVLELPEDTFAMLIGEPETGLEWVRWSPPAEPARRSVPADTAWVNEEGRAFSTRELEDWIARDREFPPRPWPGLADLSDGVAFTAVNASVSREYQDYRSKDDLLIFDVHTGRLLVEVDTTVLAWIRSASRFPGVLYSTNEATAIGAWLCDEGQCREVASYPYIGPKRGGILGVDVAPSHQRAALCANERELMFYAWEPEKRDGAIYLGSHTIPERCDEMVIVDGRRVIVRQRESGEWLLVEFGARGGLL